MTIRFFDVQCDATELMSGVDGWLRGKWKVGIHYLLVVFDFGNCRRIQLMVIAAEMAVLTFWA